MAGRRPKPAAMHRLNGNPSMLSKSELNEAENPQPALVEPEMPKGMPKPARREWRRIVPLLLNLGVLAETDGLALAAYCQAHALVEQAQKEIDAHGLTFIQKFENKEGDIVDGDIKANPAVTIFMQAQKVMKSFLIEFGLTPASRRNLKINKKAAGDPMEAFMNRKSRPQGKGPTLLTPVPPSEMSAGGDAPADTVMGPAGDTADPPKS